MKYRILVAALLIWNLSSAKGQDLGNQRPSWAGTWIGTLVNAPAPVGQQPVQVKMEIGEFPSQADSCTMWKTTYSESGSVSQVKDYRLCRGIEADDLFIDEGNDIRLSTRWIGDVLVTPFKYSETLLIVSMRLRGEVLEEEILSMADRPAIEGVQSLIPRSIQRIELRRAEESK